VSIETVIAKTPEGSAREPVPPTLTWAQWLSVASKVGSRVAEFADADGITVVSSVVTASATTDEDSEATFTRFPSRLSDVVAAIVQQVTGGSCCVRQDAFESVLEV
jgi:hypothetical protein